MIRVSESRLHSAWWALRLSFGLVRFLAGLDKFFNILTDWAQYQSPILQQVLPISATTFMRVAGVIEMIVGIAHFDSMDTSRPGRQPTHCLGGWLESRLGGTTSRS